MAEKAVIIACDILTSLGNLEKTWKALVEGRSGLTPLAFDGLPGKYPIGLIHQLDGALGSAPRLHSLLEQLFAPHIQEKAVLHKSEIILATTKGAADELLDLDQQNRQGQSWQVGTIACRISGCRGPAQTISAACSSGTIAMIQAAQKIASGNAEVVTVIGLDIVSTFVTAGFASLQALSPHGCRPFDKNRDGLSLGEGAGFAILCSESFAARKNLGILAYLAGWGASSDATHITAPSRTGAGLGRVLMDATRSGTLNVGAVNAHGTGTRYNDAMEMTAFRDMWGQIPPVHSVKGAIGHCLGAAGVIETAIAVHSLQHGYIPPTVGLNEPDFSTDSLSGSSSQQLTTSSILNCNSGFGGINAGIILSLMDT